MGGSWRGFQQLCSMSGVLDQRSQGRLPSYLLLGVKNVLDEVFEYTWFERGDKAEGLFHDGCTFTDLREERCFFDRGGRCRFVQE